MPEAQTSAEARRRPLVQYVVLRWRSEVAGAVEEWYRVEKSPAGSKPSHWLIHSPTFAGSASTLEAVRGFIPPGFKRMDRRKDDRVDVVEVWV